MAKKVTNAQMGKAIEDFNKKFKMKPKLATEGTDKDLKALLIDECISSIQKDDDLYPAKFNKATVAVVDALIAEKAGVADAEKTKEDKKEKKTEKEKEAPAGEVSLLDQVKGEMKKKVLIAFVENEDAFKADKKRLLKVKNHLSMRKEMVAILTADAPADKKEEKEKTKKKDKEEIPEEPVVQKNEVVVDPLIVEIEAAGKKKELKKIAKSDKKFKKVDLDLDVDALKKAMLKVLTPAAPKMKKGKGVIVLIVKTIEDAGKKGVSKDEILEVLVKAFPNRERKSLKSTISVQVPNRITKEKFPVEKTKEGKYRKAKK